MALDITYHTYFFIFNVLSCLELHADRSISFYVVFALTELGPKRLPPPHPMESSFDLVSLCLNNTILV